MRRRGGLFCLLMLLGWSITPALAQDTLYARLGGREGIARFMTDAVALIIEDDRIKADFDNINLDRLRGRLTDVVCHLSGGPCIYKGRSMKIAHAGLDINRAKFNAVAEDVQTAMRRDGIPYWTQNQLLALLAPMQRDIVTR